MTSEDFYTTTHDGLKLHGRKYADPDLPAKAPAIICLHGLTRNERDFRNVGAWLAGENFRGKNFRVYCLSFRGRGKSDRDPTHLNYQPVVYAQDVLGLMDERGLSDAVFIGTSLGGIVTLLLANLNPDRVKAGVLNDIGPALAPEGLARIAGYVGKTGDIATWDQAAAYIREINGVAFPHADDAFWLQFARNTFREEGDMLVLDYDPGIAQALAEAGPAPELWPVYETVTCPILSIRGESSDLFTEETQNKMREMIPATEIAVVPGIGHAPTLEEPVAKSAIQAFLCNL